MLPDIICCEVQNNHVYQMLFLTTFRSDSAAQLWPIVLIVLLLEKKKPSPNGLLKSIFKDIPTV